MVGLVRGVLGMVLLCGCATLAQNSPIHDRVMAVTAAGKPAVQVLTFGQSREGRPLHMFQVAGPGDVAPSERPAILIVAGVDPMHRIGTDVALALAQRLDAEHADALNQHTIYIVPLLNPDTWAYHDRDGRPTWDFSRTLSPDDADRDGRIDEDGPADLNGDGHITMMRVRDPSPTSGLTATLMIDPDEPRLMRAPDPLKGERATHAVLIEGRDFDGDGRIGDDPIGGVDLDMNFPAHWPEYADGAGRFPLCERESRALADWMLAKANLLAVMVYSPKDTIVRVPEAGRMEASGRVPIGIENEDRAHYEAISTLFKEVTKMRSAPTGSTAGSLWSWAYSHLGLYAYSTPLWVRPDQLEPPEPPRRREAPADDQAETPSPDEPGSHARFNAAHDPLIANPLIGPAQSDVMLAVFTSEAQPGAGRGRGAGPPRPPGGQPGGAAPRAGGSEDTQWLKYFDEHREGVGFVPWTTFAHPDLGEVEIGGFIAGAKWTPLEEEVTRLTSEQAEFLIKFIEKLPTLTVEPPVVERIANGVWRVWISVRNDGFLPMRSAIAIKARRLTPLVVRLDVPEDRVLSGRRVDNSGTSIAGSGGRHSVEWVIRGAEGDTINVEITTPEFGRREVRFELRETRP